MNVKGTRVRMGAFARIGLPTTHVNVQGSTWEGTASTVSAFLLRLLFFFLESYSCSMQQEGNGVGGLSKDLNSR